MIRVTIDLISARTGEVSKLGEMHICNDGTGTNTSCHYDGRVLTKPRFNRAIRLGRVENHKRHQLSIWFLVAKMLENMGYMK